MSNNKSSRLAKLKFLSNFGFNKNAIKTHLFHHCKEILSGNGCYYHQRYGSQRVRVLFGR